MTGPDRVPIRGPRGGETMRTTVAMEGRKFNKTVAKLVNRGNHEA